MSGKKSKKQKVLDWILLHIFKEYLSQTGRKDILASNMEKMFFSRNAFDQLIIFRLKLNSLGHCVSSGYITYFMHSHTIKLITWTCSLL